MFIDARGDERSMRVSLHPDRGVAVVSLWAGTTCRATFQLALDDAGRLADLLGASEPGPDAGDATEHPYPGLVGIHAADPVHTTGLIAVPDLPQAS